MIKYPKVSCLCPTRGRFSKLRESISFFLLQDYPNKEMIIFNNHEEPLNIHPKLAKHNIIVINAGSYAGKTIGEIYNDALTHVSKDAELIAIWDDDDMYFPWHLSSGIEKLRGTDKLAVRSTYGYWQDIHNAKKEEYVIDSNRFEASMICKKDFIFFPNTDAIHLHLPWVERLEKHDMFAWNNEVSANFIWASGKPHIHLSGSGPHANNDDTGKNQLLRPAPVKASFFNLAEKTVYTTENGKVVSLNADRKTTFIKKLLDYNIDSFEHVDKYPVWLYWNTTCPPDFIKVCHESIRNNTFADVKLLNDETVANLNLPEYFHTLAPAHKADFLRIFILCTQGGFWFDSDTYVLGDLDKYYFRYLTNHETVFPWEADVSGNLIAALLSSKPYGRIIKSALQYVKEFLSKNNEIGWSGIGVAGIFRAVNEHKHEDEVFLFGLPKIGVLGYNNNNIAAWNFDRLDNTQLNLLVFHWSEIHSLINNKSLQDLDMIKENIIMQYPSFKTLFDKQHLNYLTIS